ncbi:MAG TPA: pyridoxal-phosphate dependent enzyme [Parvularculaceae bacterium]|nr:pyridoxal-phosphate dependent enzyme [Parvularculaceae bacterium]
MYESCEEIGDLDLTNSTNVGAKSHKSAKARHKLNSNLIGIECLRCKTKHELADYFTGCPLCLAEGYPASVRQLYSADAWQVNSGHKGMTRYASCLPYTNFTTLGEGGTPLIAAPALADGIGTGAIFVKCEGQNPTGSHKDRMSALAVTRASDIGAETVIGASSGNAGASIAAYAARAGLQCVIVTTHDMNPIWRRAIAATGARLVEAKNSLDRWEYVEKRATEDGWFPVTNYINSPVGSNHFGVDGLRTIAFELFEETGAQGVDAIIVPTSRADLIWGVFEGFRFLKENGLIQRVPRLYAVEPFSRIDSVLRGSDYRGNFEGHTRQISIAGSTVTYQAIDALKQSQGGVVVVNDDAAVSDQRILAQNGFYMELSSAASLSGLRRLLDRGDIHADERVILIATSSGYKEFDF